ncbi:MAG: hypothetical protein HY960_11990 [Ignavibacteriae bacterium]|nr:hypothetical protein [Ignavibacteriota bacterium]
MKNILFLLLFVLSTTVIAICQTSSDAKDESSSNLKQYYSGKFGFYQPGDGLNNGLLIGIDGITEFTKYNFFLSGAIDFYPKQSIDIFHQPKPNVQQQQMFLLPLHVNVAYKLFHVEDADSRGYIGIGGGYYFYFYAVDYQSSSGGIFGSLTTNSETKNGGNIFGTLFARALIGKVFVEPRLYFASKSDDNVGGNNFTVNPSGFALTIGFQYHN